MCRSSTQPTKGVLLNKICNTEGLIKREVSSTTNGNGLGGMCIQC